MLKEIASCEGGNCPQVFVNDDGDVVVKGHTLAAAVRAEITFDADEDAVVIPAALLRQAARGLGSV